MKCFTFVLFLIPPFILSAPVSYTHLDVYKRQVIINSPVIDIKMDFRPVLQFNETENAG